MTNHPIFSLIFISFILAFDPVSGISTIGHGEETNTTLISPNGTFSLGFFNIGDAGMRYLGIWYTVDADETKLWVANPNAPLFSNSTALSVGSDGVLNIMVDGIVVFNISNQVSGNATATIEDSGNLVMHDETENKTIWQSFDHPYNAFLPGMKIGYNTETKQNWSLTSRVSDYYPASGSFNLSWEPIQESGQFVLYRQGHRYWTSGPLINKSFEYLRVNMPRDEYTYDITFVSNSVESYFTFNFNSSVPFSAWILRPDGSIDDLSTSNVLGGGNFCYGYKSNNGCVVSEFPKCRGVKDTFMEKRAYFLPSSAQASYDSNSSLSISDCMEKCWSICDCVGFKTYNDNDTGCTTWTGRLEYEEDNPDVVKRYILVRPKGKSRTWIVIVVVLSIIIMILSVVGCLITKKWRRKKEEKQKRREYLKELITSDSFKITSDDQDDGNELNMISFASILEATNNFSNENKLGEGGFGPVYKGKLREGQEIAIKRLSRMSGQGLVEFKNELVLIAKLQHTNLVRVLGCCLHGEEKMLIYEYMPNKSLDFYLFDPAKRELLSWPIRMNIIEGVAQGLIYLHKYSRMRVIHRDLKASNVLLDQSMNPKISDFGMARIFKQNELQAVTDRVVGTYGYMSPEYAMEGMFSIKSDVFSFGVLILEIVTGRRNTSFYNFDELQINLIGYAWELWRKGAVLDLKDATLGNSCPKNELLRIVQVGLLCVQEDATDRPTMSDVVPMLTNETLTLPAPKKPAFFTGRNMLDSSSSRKANSEDCSINYVTISKAEAR